MSIDPAKKAAMTTNDLEEMLRRWGRVYGEAPPPEWDESGEVTLGMAGGYGNNILAAAMEYAPGKIERMVSVAYARSRVALKRAKFSDPIVCSESRHYAGALYFSGAEGGKADPDSAKVERAAIDLYRLNNLRGLVLRAQYCKRGSQEHKVEWINSQGRGIGLKLRAYRDELAHARTWIHGRLS